MTDENACENVEDCISKGHCSVHGIEIERRKQTGEKVDELKIAVAEDKKHAEVFHKLLDDRIDNISSSVKGLAGSLGLLLVIVMGGFYYTNTVDTRNDRGEEILLAKINANENTAAEERDRLVNQVVTLLTSDAEQRQWQKGMMKQLELLNSHIRDIVDLRHPTFKDDRDKETYGQ